MQYGFRKHRSTTLAVYKYVQQAYTYINKKRYAVGILLDMSKAYDRVQHDTLLTKIFDVGIRGRAYSWLASYLKNRTQYVEVSHTNPNTGCTANHRSNKIITNSSIPQGSVLGCILFLIYINNLPSIVDTDCVIFADDISLLFEFDTNSERFIENMTITFKKVVQWLENHNLEVNFTKTKLMEFRPHQKSSLNVELRINNKTVKKVSTCTLLGIEIDTHLNWKEHVEKIKSKLSRFTYALYELKISTDFNTAVSAYYAYAYSWLSYGIILWGNSTEVNNLFLIQKKCMRILANINNMESCKPLFVKYNILTVTCIYILEISKFVRHNKNLFEGARHKNRYAPRSMNADKLELPTSTMALYHSSPYVCAIKIYNHLPTDIRTEQDTNCFLRRLKEWLIKKCYYHINEFFNDRT